MEYFCTVADFTVVFLFTTVHLTDIIDLVGMGQIFFRVNWALIIRVKHGITWHE